MDGQGSAFARFAKSEGTVAALEQRYIALLEQRVAQLNEIVCSSSVVDKTVSHNLFFASWIGTRRFEENVQTLTVEGNPAGNDNTLEPDKDEVDTSTSKTPLTKENLDKVVDGTAKVLSATLRLIVRIPLNVSGRRLGK